MNTSSTRSSRAMMKDGADGVNGNIRVDGAAGVDGIVDADGVDGANGNIRVDYGSRSADGAAGVDGVAGVTDGNATKPPLST